MISSPFTIMKDVITDINQRLSYIDIVDLNHSQQQSLTRLKTSLVDARLDIQDYELAETRQDLVKNLNDAKDRLRLINTYIVTNQLNVFSPTDVAHLTARIEQIRDLLK